jgi:hypothetical protein
MASFLDETLKVWQPYYDHELSQQDAEEIVANWGAFINVVAEWKANKQEGTNQ